MPTFKLARSMDLSLALCGCELAPALALGCLSYDVARVYERAADSEGTYGVVHGALTFDESRLPEADWRNQQKHRPTP